MEAPEPEAKVRKVELTVEVRRKPSRAFLLSSSWFIFGNLKWPQVRAVSGSCLSILEMFASNTIADVKATNS